MAFIPRRPVRRGASNGVWRCLILKKVKKMGFSLLVGIADLLVAGLLGNLENGVFRCELCVSTYV